MPEISVIVPVYKVENYLNNCIDSVLAQSFRDFELIMIDDGSPDDCGRICDQYAEKDNRVTVIHQQNAGVSAARNAGLDVAQGKYVAFIDSDDVINKYYLEFLHDKIIENHADISICDAKNFESLSEFDYINNPNEIEFETTCLSGKEAVLSMFSGKRERLRFEPWAKLYDRSLLEGVSFPRGMRYEDVATLPIIFKKAKRVIWAKVQLYGYRQRKDSFMHEETSIKMYEEIKAIDCCIKRFNKTNESELLKAVRERRELVIAYNSLKARKMRIYDRIPQEYRMDRRSAINKMKTSLPYEVYSYRLSKIHPIYIFIDSHIRRVLQLINLKKD